MSIHSVNGGVSCPHADSTFALYCHADPGRTVSCPLAYNRGSCVIDFGEAGAWRASLAYFMDVAAVFGQISELLTCASFGLTSKDGLQSCEELLTWTMNLYDEMLVEARAVGWSW